MSKGIEGHQRRRTILVVAAIGLIVVGSAISFSANFVAHNEIKNVIRSQLTDSSTLRDSLVVKGNPLRFLFGETPTAELRLPDTEIRKLLSSHAVFNDCQDAGRQCSSPTWAIPRIHGVIFAFDLNGMPQPEGSLCTLSYAKGSGGTKDSHVLCIDQKHDSVYYYNWSEGGRF